MPDGLFGGSVIEVHGDVARVIDVGISPAITPSPAPAAPASCPPVTATVGPAVGIHGIHVTVHPDAIADEALGGGSDGRSGRRGGAGKRRRGERLVDQGEPG